MVNIDHQAVTHLTSGSVGRPVVASATLSLDDGRQVRGFGKSYLTWGRAESKALEQAKWAAEETSLSYEVTDLAVGHGVSVTFLENEYRVRESNFDFPPFKVGLRVHAPDRSLDVSGTSFFRLERAFGDAISTAQSRLSGGSSI